MTTTMAQRDWLIRYRFVKLKNKEICRKNGLITFLESSWNVAAWSDDVATEKLN